MYQIIKNGTTLGLTEQPTFVTLLPNGLYGLCSESQACAVVFGSKVYSLAGKPDMEGLEPVSVVQVDAGSVFREQSSVQSILFVQAAESGAVDDVTAAEHAELFDEWAPGVSYKIGNIRRRLGKLYRCLQDHTSQDDWPPESTASLWKETADPAEEWPAWSRPIGAGDDYDLGARVSHKEKHWRSTVDNNVWEPGVYGWEEVTE